MSDSIKDKLLEKALDEVLDLIIGKSKEELVDIIFHDDMKKTLFKVMKEFSQKEYFQYGFREYIFLDDYSYMSKFSEEMFKLSLHFDELQENIKKVIIIYFNSDTSYKIDELTKIITNKFIAKASVKANFADLLIKQEKLYSSTIEHLNKQMEILKDIKNQKDDEENYKKSIMNGELKPILEKVLNDIANRYCHVVLKQSPQLDKNMDLYIGLQDTMKKIDDSVDNDFFSKPVRIIDASDSDIIKKFFSGDKSFEKNVSCKEFLYRYFKIPVIGDIDLVNREYANQLTKTFIKNLIKLKSQMDNGFIFTGLEFGININIENSNFDVMELRRVIREVGETITNLYDEIK